MTKKLSDKIGKNYPDNFIIYFYDYRIDFLYVFITKKIMKKIF